MANKIGRFEILSEIVRSEFSAVYKAADPDNGHTIALKTIQLQMLGDQASVLVQIGVLDPTGLPVAGMADVHLSKDLRS